MMSRVKKILLVILVAIIAIQFIQPARNESRQVLPTDISKMYNIPAPVQSVLKTACYDCHSNNTNYPWYNNVQPVAWILANHIKHGKKDLNFSDFSSYSIRKQQSKLKAISDQVKDGEMPLYSYTIIHTNARLTVQQKKLLTDWALNIKDSLDKINP